MNINIELPRDYTSRKLAVKLRFSPFECHSNGSRAGPADGEPCSGVVEDGSPRGSGELAHTPANGSYLDRGAGRLPANDECVGSMEKLRVASVLLSCLLTACNASEVPSTKTQWTKLVKVEGQSEPIPEQWLDTEEARIAHNMKLPDAVPKPVPFDFDNANWRALIPGKPKVAAQYFDHLCKSEAGEWIFKKAQNVEGLYFARPQATPTTDLLTDPYGPEMPWIQRIFILQTDRAHDNGTWFIQPPNYNYRFVEQPRREVKWQAGISEPYIRLFGYTRKVFVKEGQVVAALNEKTPMQVVGVAKPTARYGYTWRGLHRARDREFGIAGGEVLIYDLQTKEVLAVRRQFLIAFRNPRGPGKAMWEIAARCSQLRAGHDSGEFTQFAFDVLQTIEPSTTRGK